jgi:L-galactose dehydrogenase
MRSATGMDYVMLGGTGLQVSVAGLGSGGFSQLGLAAGKGEAHAMSIIHQAIDLGVNFSRQSQSRESWR